MAMDFQECPPKWLDIPMMSSRRSPAKIADIRTFVESAGLLLLQALRWRHSARVLLLGARKQRLQRARELGAEASRDGPMRKEA